MQEHRSDGLANLSHGGGNELVVPIVKQRSRLSLDIEAKETLFF